MDNRSPRPLPPPNRRRDKPQSVCNSCRKGKLRCDRTLPCGNCVRRGLELACAYANPNSAQSHAIPIVPVETDLVKRVKQLEQLVTSMVPNRTRDVSMDLDIQSTIPPQSHILSHCVVDENMGKDTAQLWHSSSSGTLKQENGSSTYVDGTHWTALLDEIHDVKEAIRTMHTQKERFLFASTVPDFHEADIIFGNYPRLNKQQLIAALPTRATVDVLVGDFFNNKCINSVTVHKASFFVEYGQFWDINIGTGSSIIWIAQLYAIMAVSAHHQDHPTPLLPDPKRIVQSHRQKIIEALVLGRYSSCPPLVVESLLIFYQLEILRTQDTGIDASLLLAIIIKLATRQGYHRDASQFPHLTALEGEMRRRVWAIILQFDAQSAISAGLPRTLRTPFYDTAEPSNLLDNDFHADDETLPLARAETVNTPVQFLIQKNRMLAIHSTISDLVSSNLPIAYNDIMTADMSLNNAYASIPLGLRMYSVPLSGEIKLPPDVIIKRIYIALIFGEAKCILHQRFVRHESTDQASSQYTYSRTTCIEAALEILSYQQLLEVETQANGRLVQERWRVDKMARNSFLLASSVLCLYLNTTFGAITDHTTEQETRQKAVTLLESACGIWSRIESIEGSVEAGKAAKAIEISLSTVQKRNAGLVPGLPSISADKPQQVPKKAAGLASIHSLLMQNSAVDYTGISARQGGG